MQNFENLTVYLTAENPVSSVISGADASGGAAAGTSAAPAPAGTAAGDPMGGMWIWILYIPLLIGLYFLMTRPQRKREKQQKEMQANLRAGDEVVTAAGFFGRIVDVGEDSFMIEFGTNRGIRVPVLKTDVLGVRSPKMTPPPKPAE